MGRIFVFLLSLLCASSVFAKLPEGVWINQTPAADDGGYGSFYKNWLFISESTVDVVVTLGAHYDKQKNQIQSDDGKRVKLLNPRARFITSAGYSVTGNVLKLCAAGNGCRDYVRATETMLPDLPPEVVPELSLSARWCVDNDCEQITYSREQSLFICNINSELTPHSSRYDGPQGLLKRYNVNAVVMLSAYRLDNLGGLSSFSTAMSLQVSTPFPRTISQSGVVRLKTGPYIILTGDVQGHSLKVEFSIHE